MGFSPLARMSRRIPDGGRSSARNSRITGFTIHHHAGVDAMGEATNPNRVVSANYWIANNGDIIPHIDETRRAWTTGATGYPAGAASDHRNITVEVSNSPEGVRNKTYAISPAAMRSLIALIGDVFNRHNLGKVRRGKTAGVAVHRDFVPTSCPGPYIMSNLSHIIGEAEKARTGKGGSGSKPGTTKPTPAPSKPSGKKWPAVALPVTKKHTTDSHNAWVKLMTDVGHLKKGEKLTLGIQRWLKKLGYYRGLLDGKWGWMTTDALQRFLRAKGLYKGLLDARTAPYSRARGAMMIGGEIAYLNQQRMTYAVAKK